MLSCIMITAGVLTGEKSQGVRKWGGFTLDIAQSLRPHCSSYHRKQKHTLKATDMLANLENEYLHIINVGVVFA